MFILRRVRVLASLSLEHWSFVAQLVIAVAGVLAFIGAAVQIRITRSAARRDLAYAYQARFNQAQVISLTARYRDYWERYTFADFRALSRHSRSQLLMVPNLIEEAAGMYNRKLIDRDVAAQVVGVLAENLWADSRALVDGARGDRGKWIYAEWEEMQADSRRRREAAHRKTERRRARRRLVKRIQRLGERPRRR